MDRPLYPVWLCGNLSTELFEEQDLGLCLEELFLLLPLLLLLGLLSCGCGFLALRNRCFLRAYSRVFHVRIFLSVLLTLSHAGLVIGSCLLDLCSSERIHVFVSAAGIFAFICLALHDFLHSRSPLNSRGPAFLLIGKCLLTLAALIWTRSVLLQTPSKLPLLVAALAHAVLLPLHLLTHVARYRSPQRRLPTPGASAHVQGYENDLARLMTGPEELRMAARPLGDLFSRASLPGKLVFGWVNPLMARGAEPHGLDSLEDLPSLPRELDTAEICLRFACARQKAVPLASGGDDQATDARPPTYRLLRILYDAFGRSYMALGLVKLLADLLAFAGPLMLNLLVEFLQQPHEPMWHGALYATILFVAVLLGAFLNAHFDFAISMAVLKLKTAIVGEFSRKLLCVRASDLGEHDTGLMMDLTTIDVDRVTNFCQSFHAFWSLPLQIIITMFLLFQQVHLASLAGLAFALLMIPINRCLANRIGHYSQVMMTAKDARVRLVTDVLIGIRSVKLLHWEPVLTAAIDRHRRREVSALKWRKYLDAGCVYFWATTPVLIAILTFVTYSLMGNKLTAPKVFTTLALLTMLVAPLNAFPWVINGLVEAWISLRRLEKFTRLPSDCRLNAMFQPTSANTTTDLWDSVADLNRPSVITMYDACFTWAPSNDGTRSAEEQLILEEDLSPVQDLTLEINRGQFIGVAGEVGSGKSSLLLALLGELRHTRGSFENKFLGPNVRVAYLGQEAWLQRGSVRDNILCGQPYDRQLYERVIDACALSADIEAMPQRDFTEVGERGTNLSGGQRTRVALARAAYLRADLYLLDDPFAALDPPVARHIVEECLMSVLGERTRVVTTHSLACLERADRVFFLSGGRLVDSVHGSLVASPDLVSASDLPPDLIPERETLLPPPPPPSADVEEVEAVLETSAGGEEAKESGELRAAVYWTYVRSVGVVLSVSVLLSLLLMQATKNASDWWLSFWVAHSRRPPRLTTSDLALSSRFLSVLKGGRHLRYPVVVTPNATMDNITFANDYVAFFLGVYGGIVGANSVFTLFRAFLFAYGGVRAAVMIHRRLLARVLAAPVDFFDRTPVGRLLNRFSSDLYTVDDQLPFQLNIFLAQLFGLLGAVTVTCYALPWIAVVMAPTAAVYWIVQQHYRLTSRELKRLSSISLSPFYCHLTECISGLMVLRGARHSATFHGTGLARLTAVQSATFACNAAIGWLSLRLQLLGVAVIGGVAFVAVAGRYLNWSSPELAGLALTYALSLTGLMGGAVRAATETEREMVAVERCREYIEETPVEEDAAKPHPTIPAEWPQHGALSYEKVSMRYREEAPLALNEVSLHISPGERFGVVGRTGSGKSSLVRCLMRLSRHQGGEVLVDDIPVSRVPLKILRSRIAVIPQEPFMFSGSLRENIDPNRSLSTDDLEQALSECCLDEVVTAVGGIDAQLGEVGRHLSAGQRQLVCLARALVRGCRLLCLDEATASIDRRTEQLIFGALSRAFRGVTVLLIAHRLRTVLEHCSRVAVLSRGQVVEVGVPSDLEARPDSSFHQLFARERKRDR